MGWDKEEKLISPLKIKIEDLEIRALSHVPEGFCRVLGLWVDPESGKLLIEYDDEPIE